MVKLPIFKAIYGHGFELKFVKLLYLMLRKQIDRFIELKNAAAKTQLQTTQKKSTLNKKNSSANVTTSSQKQDRREQRHSMIPDVDKARNISRAHGEEHNFYKVALHC